MGSGLLVPSRARAPNLTNLKVSPRLRAFTGLPVTPLTVGNDSDGSDGQRSLEARRRVRVTVTTRVKVDHFSRLFTGREKGSDSEVGDCRNWVKLNWSRRSQARPTPTELALWPHSGCGSLSASLSGPLGPAPRPLH